MPSRRSNTALHTVVIGMMGVGKSTFGRALAQRLGVDYVDSDDDIIALTGQQGKALAAEEGIAALHALETEMLLTALARRQSSVISAAASVVDNEHVRETLASGATVIWLTVPVDETFRRQADGSHRRPMDRQELEALLDRRRPLFRQLADIEVQADRRPDQLVDQVINSARWPSPRN